MPTSLIGLSYSPEGRLFQRKVWFSRSSRPWTQGLKARLMDIVYGKQRNICRAVRICTFSQGRVHLSGWELHLIGMISIRISSWENYLKNTANNDRKRRVVPPSLISPTLHTPVCTSRAYRVRTEVGLINDQRPVYRKLWPVPYEWHERNGWYVFYIKLVT